MKIETARLLIRDLEKEDERPFVAMASDGSLNDIGFDRDCSGWMANWIKEAREITAADNPNTEYLAYTIVLKDEKVVVGSVGCSYYEDFQEIGITYFIGAEYRNKGYAAEAVKAYVDYFFNHYVVSRMIATIREENILSWKVVEKVGFNLVEKRLYKDLNDEQIKLYRFYEIRRKNLKLIFQ